MREGGVIALDDLIADDFEVEWLAEEVMQLGPTTSQNEMATENGPASEMEMQTDELMQTEDATASTGLRTQA